MLAMPFDCDNIGLSLLWVFTIKLAGSRVQARERSSVSQNQCRSVLTALGVITHDWVVPFIRFGHCHVLSVLVYSHYG